MDCREPPLSTTPAGSAPWRMFSSLMKYEFGRFLVVGGTAAAANLASAWCYRDLLEDTPYVLEASARSGSSSGRSSVSCSTRSLRFGLTTATRGYRLFRFVLVSIASAALGWLTVYLIYQGLLLLPTGRRGQAPPICRQRAHGRGHDAFQFRGVQVLRVCQEGRKVGWDKRRRSPTMKIKMVAGGTACRLSHPTVERDSQQCPNPPGKT